MRTRLSLAASVLTLSLTLGACATEPAPTLEETPVAAQLVESSVPLSPAARATAVIGANGLPVGISAYPAPLDAVKAGDMAAFLQMTSGLSQEDRDVSPLFDAFLALDRAADGDTTAARNILKTSNSQSEEEGETGFYAFLDAWLLAMDGKPDQAIERHRGAAGAMPGLTGDLSLAAMLEALDRPEQALAVYEFMTPAEIEAPEHQFDPKGLLYSHIRTVVSRHALLLQRLGRIEEAKAVYQKLADAEPEEAISYAAAIESLETGKNLDNEALDVRAAWPEGPYDAVFGANVAHIMDWTAVEALFSGAARVLRPAGRLCLYGPFLRRGKPPETGNAAFDAALRDRDPAMGLREIEALDALGEPLCLSRVADIAMPSDNRLLIWQKAADR